MSGPATELLPPTHRDGGEMAILMAGFTFLLLGMAGMLLWLLGRPASATSPAVSQDSSLAAAQVLLGQALEGRLTAADVAADPDALNVDAACTAAAGVAARAGAEVADCTLLPAGAAGISVVTIWGPRRAARDGQNPQGGEIMLMDRPAGCLALRTSWGETLATRCPDGGTPGRAVTS